MTGMDEFHSLAEARSWALHVEVAARLADRPEILLRAKRRVDQWLARPGEHPYASAWQEILSRPLSQIGEAIVERSSWGCTLRQASPFAGAIDPKTRWQILKRPELRPREAG